MKLNVTLIRQEKNSLDCGIVCLAMLFKYYNINHSYEQIKKDLKIYDNIGTFAPQLASYMIKHGFEAEIVILNPFIFSYNEIGKNSQELISHLENLLQEKKSDRIKMVIKYFIQFLKDGGKITVKIPTFEDIQKEIAAGRPIGTLLTTRFMQDKPVFNFHINLITGFEKDSVIVSDPAWNENGGEFKYPKDLFFHGLVSSSYGDPDNGCLMFFRKK